MSESRKARVRDVQMTITATEKERERFKDAAFDAGMTFSSWARMILTREINK